MTETANLCKLESDALLRYRAYLKLLAKIELDTYLKCQMDASDLAQQTLHDAVAHADQFRGKSEGELLSWLRKILANNLVDAVRYAHRDKRNLAITNSLDESVVESFQRIDLLAQSCSTPSQKAAQNELLLRLPEALEALSEAQREAIVLHHLQGMKLAETAERMDKSESAVCGLLHRGLKKLHEILGE